MVAIASRSAIAAPRAARTVACARPMCLARRPAVLAKAQMEGRRAEKAEWSAPSLFALTAALGPMALAPMAFAEEAAVEAAAQTGFVLPGGISVPELAILLSPAIAYGLFNVVRNQYFPRAGLMDFAFFLVLTLILLNIISIVIFRVRFF
ncbi:hypothetical protein HYH03_003641 [Edaphochlamys debaryana]|uniref:Uncharacterized protein n=1 Tax=Edaphochlamys debaryana TaxID=47281 RepID=A0A835YBE0_9CHLO|nr:hypothetical protein HYH03_003641 [Edaphochlamys debaryana]|eukprot:KAG2498382.1 hypothetical protein HYH03_003641 [Edaphochlamys debaryana]